MSSLDEDQTLEDGGFECGPGEFDSFEDVESPIGREDVNKRYFEVARIFAQDRTFDGKKNGMPSRAPYKPHAGMMHGAKYFCAFKVDYRFHFISLSSSKHIFFAAVPRPF